jgi:hypothetical protein
MSSRSIAAVVSVLMTAGVHTEPTRADDDRYGHMHMVLERTWFGIDVARVDVWFDPAARDALQRLVVGQRYSEERAERIARVAMQAADVHVQVEMLRDGSLGQFLDAVHDNLVHARDAGYISADDFTAAWQSVQKDFAPLAKRGLKRGDRLIYRGRGDSLQTLVVAGDRVLLDLSSDDPRARPAMVAGYFAPKTDFREKLIRSLF